MNEKKAKALRKEMRKFFGDPTTEKRMYQAVSKRFVTIFDKDEKITLNKERKIVPIAGTIKAVGMRRLYQDTKITVKKEGL